MYKVIVLASFLMASSLCYGTTSECDISGEWQHSAKPATLYVDIGAAEISVQSHDDNAKAIGLVVLKNLEAATVAHTWHAKMYSAADDAFVDVLVKSSHCNQLIVSYNGEQILTLLR